VSNTSSSKWREQYDRMKRWRARLNESGHAEERRRDDIYAFFVCCYHLKDWIKKDASLDEDVHQGVESFVNSNRTLGLAADVANGFKHLERDQKPRVDPSAHVSVVGGFHVGMPEPALSGIVVAGDQTWEDASVLADRCIEEWEGFLRRHRLP
jgi:hypothetical protein